jgi:hypothetical protein
MAADDDFRATRASEILRASPGSGNFQKPAIVLRVKPRAMQMSEALDMSYVQLAALKTAPMGKIYGAQEGVKSTRAIRRALARRPNEKRDIR